MLSGAGLTGRPVVVLGMMFAAVHFASQLLVFTAAPHRRVLPVQLGESWTKDSGMPLIIVPKPAELNKPDWRQQGVSWGRMAIAAFATISLASGAAIRHTQRMSSTQMHAQGIIKVERAHVGFGAASSIQPAQTIFAGAAMEDHSSRADNSHVARNLLMPKVIRYKKPHRPVVKPFNGPGNGKWKFRGFADKGSKPHFGKYALQATEEAWVTSKQIEGTRRTITRVCQRKGKLWIRAFPHNAICKRAMESRLGAGKGNIEYWVAAVRPNFILFELDGVPEETARYAFRKCIYQLPMRCRFIKKADGPSRFELGLAGTAGRGGGDPRKFQKFSK